MFNVAQSVLYPEKSSGDKSKTLECSLVDASISFNDSSILEVIEDWLITPVSMIHLSLTVIKTLINALNCIALHLLQFRHLGEMSLYVSYWVRSTTCGRKFKSRLMQKTIKQELNKTRYCGIKLNRGYIIMSSLDLLNLNRHWIV